ncbi:S-layer homology domain-containing protein [Aneurinibacillus aneurinilyticus]|uniref:S-layer homology domain-containing protein n=1 Tax=Aneurinibacillus aneurinilyticus TaxID=1391 RepID=UPI002E1DD502|nr:S-layer homology domain-containing protein [Aneurinibacillus aneurinilyticus]
MRVRSSVRRIVQMMAIVLCLFVSMSSVFAAVNVTPQGKPDGSISVTGTSDHKKAPVALLVKEGNETRYINQGMTNDQGEYEFSFQLDPEKAYTGKVNVEGETKTFAISTKKQGEGGGTGNSGNPETPKPGTDKSKTIYLRIEGYNQTILPRTAITVDNFDLTPYLGRASGSSATPSDGWGPDKLPNVTAIHGIIRGLEQAGINPKDHQSGADIQDYGWGLYVAMIGGEREFDHRSTSGWMYRVNDELPSIGGQGYVLKDGDDMVWYFAAYGYDNMYSKIAANKTSVKPKEEIEVTLTSPDKGPVKNAVIYVNGQEAKNSGRKVSTDEQGKAKLTFDRPGSYTISAERFKQDIRDLIRPNPIKIEVNGEAAAPISIEELKKQFEELLAAANKEEDMVALIRQAVDQAVEAKRENDTQITEAIKNMQTIAGWIDKAAAKASMPASFTALAECNLRLLELAGELVDKPLSEAAKKEIEAVAIILLNGYVTTISKADEAGENAEAFVRLIKAVDKLHGKIDEKKIRPVIERLLSKSMEIAVKKEHIQDDGTKLLVIIDDTIIKEIERVQQKQKAIKQGIATSKLNATYLLDKPLTLLIPPGKSDKVRIQIDKEILDRLVNSINIRTQAAQFTLQPAAFAGVIEQGKVLTLQLDKVDAADYPTGFVSASESVHSMFLIDATVTGATVVPQQPIMFAIPYELPEGAALPAVYTSIKNERVSVPTTYNKDEKMLVTTLSAPGPVLVLTGQTGAYTDLAGFEWAKEAIYALKQKGIISGTSEMTFSPGKSITRAEFAALLARAYEQPATEKKLIPFRDVTADKWYAKDISVVYHAGIMTGISVDRFGPEQVISREEAAAVVSRLLKQKKGIGPQQPIELSFKDKQAISEWARQDIAFAVQQGIITGMGDQTFAPKRQVKRAEAAVMLYGLERLLTGK